jgi:hypothetical protein
LHGLDHPAPRIYLVGVVQRLQDMPPGTLGFRATGRITREDYADVLVPELEKALEGGGRLRTLYAIEDLDEIEPSALWADSKLGFDLAVRHHDAWERSAIVTDIEWMARATRMFAWMIPGEVRVLALAELEQAKAWVAGAVD